jgi:hypothetical protein
MYQRQRSLAMRFFRNKALPVSLIVLSFSTIAFAPIQGFLSQTAEGWSAKEDGYSRRMRF